MGSAVLDAGGVAMAFQVDLYRAVVALSDALDLVGVDAVGHGHRVGLMAEACAGHLGWDKPARIDLLQAGLLHDCGVSTTHEHRHLVTELDWSGSDTHCQLGARYLAEVPMLAHLGPVIREHHSHWRSLRARAVPPAVARPANLIYLVDRVDALHATGQNPAGIELVIRRHADDYFCPELVEAYAALSRCEAFWYVQDEPGLHERIGELMGDAGRATMDFVQFRALATAFGHIIDAKSPHTVRHSAGVAQLARVLGGLAGMDSDAQDELELAGLLHDILRHIFGDSRVVQWAALHHEMISGQGYPFHLGSDDLPQGARVVAVADVFQALAQHRPYRAPLPPAAISRHLGEMAAIGHLDPGIVALAQANLDACWQAACVSEPAKP